MMRKFLLIITAITLYCCKSGELSSIRKINNCINSTNILNEEKLEINYYNELLFIEKMFVNGGLLEDFSKESYVQLLQNLSSLEEGKEELIRKLKNFNKNVDDRIKNRDILINTSTLIASFKCNKIAQEKKLKNSDYYNSLSKILTQGDFDNFFLIKQLINSIPKEEFSNFHYRLPIVFLFSLISEHYAD